MTTLADAWVEVHPRKGSSFDSDAKGIGTAAGTNVERGLAPGLKRAIGALAGTFAAKKVLDGANKLVGRASDLNETVNKSEVIFGRQAARMDQWASRSDTAFGLSKTAALGAAAGLGDMFSQLGFAEKAAAGMSRSTVRMAADLGSFNNLPTEDVLERISAGFRGEYDSLQKVIPAINAARVEQVALEQTGKKVAKNLTAQEKAAATLAIIQKDGARATGDFARTQDGLANSQKVVGAQVENLKTKIGQGLLPVWAAGSKVLRKDVLPPLIDFADKWVPKAAAAVSGWLGNADFSKVGDMFAGLSKGGASGNLSSIGDAFGKIGDSVSGIDWDKVKSGLGEGTADTISVFAVAVGFAADHVDELAKYLPALVLGLVAFKAAQAAGNVAALAAIPITVLQIGSNIALASANRSLAAATLASTTAQNGETAARGRGVIAILAHKVATLAASAATKTMAAGQWLLNAAMSANPIGLVVAAVAGLVTGFVLLYKKSDTFRGMVDGLWNNVLKPFGEFLGKVFVGYVKLLASAWLTMGLFGVRAFRLLLTAAFKVFDGILAAAEKGLGWIPGLGGKIKTAREAFRDFGDRTIGKLKGVESKLRAASRAVDDLGKKKPTVNVRVNFIEVNKPKALTLGSIAAGTAAGTYGGGRADGGPTRRGRTYRVGERGPEYLTMMSDGHVTPHGKVPGAGVTIENLWASPTAESISRSISNEQRKASLMSGLTG